jgi:hypothetical protein
MGIGRVLTVLIKLKNLARPIARASTQLGVASSARDKNAYSSGECTIIR